MCQHCYITYIDPSLHTLSCCYTNWYQSCDHASPSSLSPIFSSILHAIAFSTFDCIVWIVLIVCMLNVRCSTWSSLFLLLPFVPLLPFLIVPILFAIPVRQCATRRSDDSTTVSCGSNTRCRSRRRRWTGGEKKKRWERNERNEEDGNTNTRADREGGKRRKRKTKRTETKWQCEEKVMEIVSIT